MPKENVKNFAETGTESFRIKEQEAAKNKDRIVLNIQEEKYSGLVLDKKKGSKIDYTGSFLIDTYHKFNRYLVSHSNVKIKEKATFFHLLAVMINAGIPMVKALRSLMEQSVKSPRLYMVIERIANDIEAGSSLSEAMIFHSDVFSEAEIGMVQSGEASGQLTKVLDNLAADTEKAYQIRGKIKSAMTYPIVIFVLLLVVVTAMMVFVIPKLTSLFESTKADLPLITKIVVGISDFMINQKYFLMIVVLFLILVFILFKKTDIGRYAIDKFKISIPIFGPLYKMSYLSRFARSLSNLLDSNISIVKAVEITGNSVGNEVYKKRILLSMEDIKQGIPLAESLSESPLFPPMLVSMIDVGEKTAQTDEIAGKVATFYENEVDTAVSGISKIIEPVILIIIGLAVGTVVAAIMLPIMKLADLTSAM